MIVPERDSRAVAAAMVQIMEADLPAMRSHAHRVARERFDVRTNVARIRSIFEDAARPPRRIEPVPDRSRAAPPSTPSEGPDA